MAVLDYRTALVTVQNALYDLIWLGLGKRIVVADGAALAAFASRGAQTQSLTDHRLAFVTTPPMGAGGNVYRYSRTATTAADGVNVIGPTDAGAGPGRWICQSSPILDATGTAIAASSAGYLKRVMLWAGTVSDDVWRTRVLAQRPCVILQFEGETKTIHANQRGALAEKVYHFGIWAVSTNLRPDIEAEKGSPIAAEAAADPGVARIMGDLEYMLDGRRGVDLDTGYARAATGLQAGVDFLQFGSTTPQTEDYDGREFVWVAPLDVRVTVGREDPVRVALVEATAQPADVQLHAAPSFDPNNYIVAGLTVATGAGFVRGPVDGSAMVGGALVTVSGAPAHTFAAQAATYRDLNGDGSWTYSATPTDAEAPALAAGALRVAVTFTDANGITEDRLLAPTSVIVGPQQVIPTT